jgi:hypothetical protein
MNRLIIAGCLSSWIGAGIIWVAINCLHGEAALER